MTAAPARRNIDTDLHFDGVLYVVGSESAKLVRRPGLIDHVVIFIAPTFISIPLSDMTMRGADAYRFWDVVNILALPIWVALYAAACRRFALWRDVRALVRATALHRVPA